QMSKRRHALTKKTSSTPGMFDAPRLTRVIENHTPVTERHYVRPQWAPGEDQPASQPACYAVYHRTAFLPPFLPLRWKRILFEIVWSLALLNCNFVLQFSNPSHNGFRTFNLSPNA